MKNLWLILSLIVVATAAGALLTERKFAALRARGVYPEKGKEKEGDVLRLLELGEETLAIRCYRSLHRVSLKKAKEDVLALKREVAHRVADPV